jgi:hypothetical protein
MMENPHLKRMTWGYPYFRKPPYEIFVYEMDLFDCMLSETVSSTYNASPLRLRMVAAIHCLQILDTPGDGDVGSL